MTSTGPAAGTDAGWLVVVPVKRLDAAKTRLSTRPAGVRRHLALAFALDTVAAALGAHGVAEVHVVTDDEEVGAAVVPLGAGWVRDDTGAGLNEALRHAELVLRHAELVLRHDRPGRDIAALAGDLPALSADVLGRALAMAAEHDRSFVPDAAGTGTTFLAARAGVPLDPRFGPRSCAAHAASGAERLDPGDSPGLRRDVDTEVDLWDAVRLGVGPATTMALDSSS